MRIPDRRADEHNPYSGGGDCHAHVARCCNGKRERLKPLLIGFYLGGGFVTGLIELGFQLLTENNNYFAVAWEAVAWPFVIAQTAYELFN